MSQERGFVLDRDEPLKSHTDEINRFVDEIYARITAAANVHLNLGQNVTVDRSAVFFSLERPSSSSMSKKQVQSESATLIRFPSTIDHPIGRVFLQKTIVEPLARRGDGLDSTHNQLSRSLSLSFYDRSNDEMFVRTNDQHPIEFFIPRDGNLQMPPLIRQNVTERNYSFPFKLHRVELVKAQPNKDLPVSLHIEINPLNTSVAYLLIFRMDEWAKEIDGWTLLCPSSEYSSLCPIWNSLLSFRFNERRFVHVLHR